MTTIDSNWCRAHRDSATHWTTAHHSSPQPPTIRTHKTNTETRYLLNKETHTHTHIFELFYTKKNNTKKVCGNVCSFNREINTAVFCATSVCERERGGKYVKTQIWIWVILFQYLLIGLIGWQLLPFVTVERNTEHDRELYSLLTRQLSFFGSYR